MSQSPVPECMSARAVIERVEPGRVGLRLLGDAACGTCAGSCMWQRAAQRCEIDAASGTLAAGDPVLVSLPATHVLAGSLLLHGLPWLGLLLGGLIGHVWSGTDAGCLLGAVLGAGVPMALMPGARRRFEGAIAAGLRLQSLR